MAAANSRLQLLTPQNSALILIDHQPQMTFGVQSIDRQTLYAPSASVRRTLTRLSMNNTVALAKSAKIFGVPTIFTAVETLSFSGYIWPQLLDVFPSNEVIERSSMNSWEDAKLVEAVKKTGRKKLIMAALWTEVCLCFPTIEAIRDGYDVYIVTDASGGTTKEAHDVAVQRMVQAGAIPVTWLQVLLEFQRDWSRREHYNEVMSLVKEHAGAYGVGVEYAYSMVHKVAPKHVHGQKADGAKH